jgi:hypothetical protein
VGVVAVPHRGDVHVRTVTQAANGRQLTTKALPGHTFLRRAISSLCERGGASASIAVAAVRDVTDMRVLFVLFSEEAYAAYEEAMAA